MGIEVLWLRLHHHGRPLPHYRVCLRIKFHRAGVVVGRTAGTIVDDGKVAVGQPVRGMRPPQRLIPVIRISGRSCARAVVGGVAPTVHDIAGLAIDNEYFRQIAGSHRDLICSGIVGNTVEMRPVRSGIDIIHPGRAELVDVNLVLALADMIPHMPFPHCLAGGAIHFTDKVGPDAIQMTLAFRKAFLENVPILGCFQSLCHGFVIALVFPPEQQIVAVGHDFIGVVRYFLAGSPHLVFPDFLAIPVELFHDPGCAAEPVQAGFIGFGNDAMTRQRAISFQFRPEPLVFAFPFVDDFAVIVDQVRRIATLGGEQNITVRHAGFIGKHAQRTAECFIRRSGSRHRHREDGSCRD